MTVTEPSASTALNRRTTALRFAIRSTPSASVSVSTAGSPSGTAATARATAKSNTWPICDIPSIQTPRMAITTASARIPRAICPPKTSIRCSSGVRPASIPPIITASRPIALSAPVRLISRYPFPRTSSVPLKFSCPRSFSTGTDSPVRIDSSTETPCPSISTPSAGIRSPASTRTRSPGTSSVFGRCASFPSRITQLTAPASVFKCASADSALFS